MAFPFQSTPAIPEEGFHPIARYLFEEDLTDSVGTYDGTAIGSPTYNSDAVEGGFSLNIASSADGSNMGQVNLTSAFTIYLNHKRTNTSNTGAIVLWGNHNTATGDGVSCWLNTWATTNGNILVYTGDGTTKTAAATGNGVYTSNAWNNICVVFDGSDFTIYIDGVDETISSGYQPGFNTSGQDFYVGNWSGEDYGALGLMDDVVIYNVAHTATEVLANQPE